MLNEEVADTALGLLLATVRQLPQAESYLRKGQWLGGPFPLTATLQDRRIGIIGLGRIGKAIARRLEAFGRPIVYYGRSKQTDVSYPYYSDLIAMARDVDVLLSVLPGGKVTDKICGQAVFEALGPNGIFINIGRGSTVDEDALIAALRNRTILSAGLDVFADEPRVAAGVHRHGACRALAACRISHAFHPQGDGPARARQSCRLGLRAGHL